MAELEELEQEELDRKMLQIGYTDNVPLPSVPSTSLPSRKGKKFPDFIIIIYAERPCFTSLLCTDMQIEWFEGSFEKFFKCECVLMFHFPCKA